jgi:hypothetical protein
VSELRSPRITTHSPTTTPLEVTYMHSRGYVITGTRVCVQHLACTTGKARTGKARHAHARLRLECLLDYTVHFPRRLATTTRAALGSHDLLVERICAVGEVVRMVGLQSDPHYLLEDPHVDQQPVEGMCFLAVVVRPAISLWVWVWVVGGLE